MHNTTEMMCETMSQRERRAECQQAAGQRAVDGAFKGVFHRIRYFFQKIPVFDG